MPTETRLKPWAELGEMERREAIARRIYKPGQWIPIVGRPQDYELPDWPTDDALAFTEVWTKLAAFGFLLGIESGSNKPCVWTPDADFPLLLMERGDTWADAICQCAYSLLLPDNPA